MAAETKRYVQAVLAHLADNIPKVHHVPEIFVTLQYNTVHVQEYNTVVALLLSWLGWPDQAYMVVTCLALVALVVSGHCSDASGAVPRCHAHEIVPGCQV